MNIFYLSSDPGECARQHFAELVVKECLKECWYDKTPLEISNAIRAKFGMDLEGE